MSSYHPTRNCSKRGRGSVKRPRQTFLESEKDSSLAGSLIAVSLPKFKLLPLRQYDKNDDPETTYKHTETPWCFTRPLNLFCLWHFHYSNESAKDWFNSLSHELIASLRDLAYAFCNKFAASKKRKNPPTVHHPEERREVKRLHLMLQQLEITG